MPALEQQIFTMTFKKKKISQKYPKDFQTFFKHRKCVTILF